MTPTTIRASIFGGNLGDTLWVTPLSRYFPDNELIVQMRGPDAKARATAPILEGLALKVEWVDSPSDTPRAPVKAHITQQILTYYGLGGKPSIPRIVLRAEEIMWAMEHLRPYGNKMVAIINHNSASADPTNHRAHYVRGNPEAMRMLARFWMGAGYNVLQFGPAPSYYTNDPFIPIKEATWIRGLSVRELAACYHIIGKLISGDTGDYHLMLAVGGRAAVLVPPHSDAMGYRHWDLLYDQVCWGDERPRVRYALHSDYTNFMSTNLFKQLV